MLRNEMRTLGFLLAAFFLGAACSKGQPAAAAGKKGDEKKGGDEVWKGPFGTKKLVVVDLAPGGLEGLTIKAPEGATVRTRMGVAEVGNPDGYLVWIAPATESFEAEKEQLRKGAHAPLKRFVEEEPNYALFELNPPFGGPAFHFLMHVKVGDETWRCASATSVSPSEAEEAAEMAKTCRTLAKR